MTVRFLAWIMAAALFAIGGAEQLGRWVGPVPTFSLDLSVPNEIVILTFLIGIAASVGIALGVTKQNRLHCFVLLVVMLVPIWLSTRHVWIPFGSADLTESAFLIHRRISPDADPEMVCYVEKNGMLTAVAERGNGPELWSVFIGIWPWNIKNHAYKDLVYDDHSVCETSINLPN